MMAVKVAVLYRGGPDSDARLHLAVGDHPTPPSCAGAHPSQVVLVEYPYLVPLLEVAPPPLREALNAVAEQITIRQLGVTLTDTQRERLCHRCATDLLETPKSPPSSRGEAEDDGL